MCPKSNGSSGNCHWTQAALFDYWVVLIGIVRCSLTPNFVSKSLSLCQCFVNFIYFRVNFLHIRVNFIPFFLFIHFFLLNGIHIILILTSTTPCLLTFVYLKNIYINRSQQSLKNSLYIIEYVQKTSENSSCWIKTE